MIVFVHGVPETAALWDHLRSHLETESVAVALPGFGGARPDGFGASKDDYASWLIAELAKFDEPVDLVGHDWGAGLTYRVATSRGDLIRSWVADVANIFHPEYEWHDFARIWQTPGAGEEFFASQAAVPAEQRAVVFEALGVPHDDAVALAAATDDTMASCVLDLYRSATPNAYADWKDDFRATSAPGLVLWPTEDPFGEEAKSRQVAEILGAQHLALDGLSHWWPLQAPEVAAGVLTEFWSSLDLSLRSRVAVSRAPWVSLRGGRG